MLFTKAIVRIPCERMTEGLSSSGFGKPDYSKAIMQHEKYVQALEDCGLEVIVLPSDNDFPDSTFVEDTALLTPVVAVITLPGAPSRRCDDGGQPFFYRTVGKNEYRWCQPTYQHP